MNNSIKITVRYYDIEISAEIPAHDSSSIIRGENGSSINQTNTLKLLSEITDKVTHIIKAGRE